MATKKNSKNLKLNIKKAVKRNLSEIRKSMEKPTKFELSADKSVFLSVSKFNGHHYIHIRTWEDGKPTKNGISLTEQMWWEIQRYISELDSYILQVQQGNQDVDYKCHLGKNWYICVQSNYTFVNIRRYWTPPGTVYIHPTKQGQILSFDMYNKMKDLFNDINACIPNFDQFQPCYMQLDHANVLGALACSVCNPTGYKDHDTY